MRKIPYQNNQGAGGLMGHARKLIAKTRRALSGGGGGLDEGTEPVFFASWKDGVSVGNLPNDSDHQEISGLANPFLEANSNYLFGISDGGNNFLLAIDKRDGSSAGKLTFTGTVSDVEDIASAMVDGQAYIYFADFGDNSNARSTFRIYRIKEPTITGSNFTIDAGDVELITCQYTGTAPTHKDAECLIVDTNGDMYIITKRESVPGVYKLDHAASYAGTQDFVFQGDMASIPSSTSPQATGNVVAGCISPDGKRILVKNYADVYYFPRDIEGGQTILAALQQSLQVEWSYVGGGQFPGTPTGRFYQHPAYEPQGEAITFDYGGGDYYTASEYQSSWGSTASTFPLFKYEMASGAATTIEFQDGVHPDGLYAGTDDTYLESSSPGTNHGNDATFIVDIGPGTREGLLRFDQFDIPLGSTLIGADLILYVDTEGQGWNGHRMLKSWSPATATYTLLGSLPADDVSLASAVLFTDNATDTSLNSYVGHYRHKLNIAQMQLDMAAGGVLGFGILATHITDGQQFGSGEATTASERPHLILRYIPPA